MKSICQWKAAWLLGLLWGGVPAHEVQAQPNHDGQTFSAKLSRQEAALLEQKSCLVPYGIGVASIDAQAFEKNAAASFAEVKCRPHAYLQQQAMYYVRQCAREGQQWSCNPAELETRVLLHNQTTDRILLVRPGTVKPEMAVQAIQTISRYGYFQGQSIDAALQSTCHIGLGEKPDLLEISCARWSLTVSFWCPAAPAKTACPRIILMSEHAE